jgi:hypothetical protein
MEKKFIWRACHEILPTRANLYKRKIIDDPKCPMCGREEETTFHALWSCPAMDVWGAGPRVFQKSCFLGPVFLQVVKRFLTIGDMEESCQFAGIVKRIWLRHNEVLHGGLFTRPTDIIQRSLEAIEEFQRANMEDGVMGNRSTGETWSALPQGWV